MKSAFAGALTSSGCQAFSATASIRPRCGCAVTIALRRPASVSQGLVLHAQGDAVIPFAEGRLLATLIPGARFVPLDSRNHILLEHEPAWQEFLSQIRKFLVASDAAPALAPHQALGALSARERALLDLIAQGLDNGQIAERLAISPNTVRNHITSIFSKLAVQTRAQAIVLARNAGLGQLPNTPA